MTKTEIIQFIAQNHWLVTEQVAQSMTAIIDGKSGISDKTIAQRRARADATYCTQLYAVDSKRMYRYKRDKRRQPNPYNETEIYANDNGEDENGETAITAEGIAIVYIHGAILKDGHWCVMGTTQLNEELIALGQDSRVKGVMLHIDSGGGQVAGTETLADTIYGFNRKYKKRIEAYIEQAGSAAYWIAAGADRIILAGETANVGSIGTMATIVNTKGYEAAIGLKVENIYATLSINKNREYEEVLKGNPEPMRTDILDKINTQFLRAVIRGRYLGKYVAEELTLENIPPQFTGKVYFGSEAIAIGLADSINTFEGALMSFDTRIQRQIMAGSSTTDEPMDMPNPLQKIQDKIGADCLPDKEHKERPTSLNVTPLNSIFYNRKQ